VGLPLDLGGCGFASFLEETGVVKPNVRIAGVQSQGGIELRAGLGDLPDLGEGLGELLPGDGEARVDLEGVGCDSARVPGLSLDQFDAGETSESLGSPGVRFQRVPKPYPGLLRSAVVENPPAHEAQGDGALRGQFQRGAKGCKGLIRPARQPVHLGQEKVRPLGIDCLMGPVP
jgi:hypothetical protein